MISFRRRREEGRTHKVVDEGENRRDGPDDSEEDDITELDDHLDILARDVGLGQELLLPDALEEVLLIGVLRLVELGGAGTIRLGRCCAVELLLDDGKEASLEVRKSDLCSSSKKLSVSANGGKGRRRGEPRKAPVIWFVKV